MQVWGYAYAVIAASQILTDDGVLQVIVNAADNPAIVAATEEGSNCLVA